ncbi:MAG: hypothetical protein LUF78_10810 [Clostridiales bacterium]|nr:hypothetical protein [Clostridiales bacterium]
MGTRLELHAVLVEVLGSDHVYFQPPETLKIEYPCIIYNRTSEMNRFANDSMYYYRKRYEITVIDKDPDTEIPDKVAALPFCIHDRNYTADNLNHYIYKLYY